MFGKIIEKISYNLSDEHFSFKSILLILFISAIIICIIYYIAKAIEGSKEKKNFRNIRVNANKKANLRNVNNSFKSIDNINGIVENIITKGISNIRNWFSNTSIVKDNIKNISNNNNYNANYNNNYNEGYINYSEDNYYNVNNHNYNDNYNNEEIYYNNSDVIDEIDYIDDSIDYIDDIANVENANNMSNDNNVNNNGFGFKFNKNRKNTIYHDEEDDFF